MTVETFASCYHYIMNSYGKGGVKDRELCLASQRNRPLMSETGPNSEVAVGSGHFRLSLKSRRRSAHSVRPLRARKIWKSRMGFGGTQHDLDRQPAGGAGGRAASLFCWRCFSGPNRSASRPFAIPLREPPTPRCLPPIRDRIMASSPPADLGLPQPVSAFAFRTKALFLVCVLLAGVYGAATVSRSSRLVRATPAAIALILLPMASGEPRFGPALPCIAPPVHPQSPERWHPARTQSDPGQDHRHSPPGEETAI